MKAITKDTNRANHIFAFYTFYRGMYRSEPIYLIKKNLKDTNTPDICLWMSDWDYRKLVMASAGTDIKVLEVEANTIRVRRAGECPEGTEKFKFVVIS